MSDLRTVSLFAGIGGIDRGLELAGATTALACELDSHARKILARHYPHAAIHNDVTELTADDCRAAGAVPERTILTAGFPCQDLSVAGRRRGMGEGTRSGLYWHVDRLLAEFRPAWVILENVPGLLSAACPCPGDGTCPDTCPGELHAVPGGVCEGGCVTVHGGTMGAVLGSLAERGYGFAYRVLDARHFGVPQRRRRVVIVGRLGDTGAASAQVLLEPEGVPGDPAAGIAPRPIAAGHAGTGTAGRGWVSDLAPTLEAGTNNTGGTRPPGTTVDTVEALVVGALTARYGKGTDSDATDALVVAFSHTAGLDVQPSASVAPTLKAGHDTMPSVVYAADYTTALDTAQGGPDDNTAQGGQLVAFHDVIATPLALRGREGGAALEIGDPNGPYNTLRAGDGGSSRQSLVQIETGGDVIVRRLTPVECERLQGYPDNWTEGQADSQRYKQLGNSVAVPVFEWVGRRLIAVDNHLATLQASA